ncbi:MAG: segregation and condensation protein A [Candidatus Scalinduaceae bacterium]
MQTEYKIDLEIYNGPLDLLLYLIRREEVDICDIPIAKITDQYMVYLDKLQKVDIGLAGDFLVMSSTLMYIKSQMLLPQTEGVESGEEDPRLELVKQLLEYKRYKETTSTMVKMAEERSMRCSRPEVKMIDEEEVELMNLEEIEVWKLSYFFANFMNQTLGDMDTTIVSDEIPVQTYMDNVINSLVSAYVISFNELYFNTRCKTDIIGFFLALLELVRLKKIKLEQCEDFGEIKIISNNN